MVRDLPALISDLRSGGTVRRWAGGTLKFYAEIVGAFGALLPVAGLLAVIAPNVELWSTPPNFSILGFWSGLSLSLTAIRWCWLDD